MLARLILRDHPVYFWQKRGQCGRLVLQRKTLQSPPIRAGASPAPSRVDWSDPRIPRPNGELVEQGNLPRPSVCDYHLDRSVGVVVDSGVNGMAVTPSHWTNSRRSLAQEHWFSQTRAPVLNGHASAVLGRASLSIVLLSVTLQEIPHSEIQEIQELVNPDGKWILTSKSRRNGRNTVRSSQHRHPYDEVNWTRFPGGSVPKERVLVPVKAS